MPANSFLPLHRPDHRALSTITLYSRFYNNEPDLLRYLGDLSEKTVSILAGEMGLKKSASKADLVEKIRQLVMEDVPKVHG